MTRSCSQSLRLRLLGAAVLAACGLTAYAAEDPDAESEAAVPARPAPPTEIDYLFRDVGADALDHEAEHYTLRPVIAILADYTFFTQDDASVAQVGEQEDSRDLRAGRLGLLVRGKGDQAWEGYVAADFQERRTREDAVFQLYDLRFGIPVGAVNLDIGKQKQPFVYEMVGLSLLNPQQERILSPFRPPGKPQATA